MKIKKNKARGILLKAIGSAMLIFAFVAQNLIYMQWAEHHSAATRIYENGVRLLTTWERNYGKWGLEQRPQYMHTELQDTAQSLLTNLYEACTILQSECHAGLMGGKDWIDQQTVKNESATSILSFVDSQQRIHRNLLGRVGSEIVISSYWSRASKLLFIAAYSLGSIVLLLGLFFEWKGVDE